ncbi:hypothetical protein [Cryobacterium sp. Hz9]|uniref:hypothetical protein n=1 Tax=Cryobacterium sp. Hz9 TaxID=1259167 RepID=UPI00106BA747|nr:hypothetical protein [Cryobacterium sp. Hz9]TFB69855.1 hypothetical protein E3N85_02375 [Cryobacterium sp. Hz9]
MLAVFVRTVDAQPKDPNDYWSSSRPTPVPQYLLDLSQDTERTIVPQIVEGTTEFTARLRFLAGGDGGYVQGVTRFDAATGAER